MASHRDFVSVRAATGGRDGNLKGGLWRRRTTQGGTLCQGGSYEQFISEPGKLNEGDRGANRLVHCVARLRLSRLSA